MTLKPPSQVLAGLGNHAPAAAKLGCEVSGTRHNAGFELINRLRQSCGADWTQGQACLSAHVTLGGLPLLLLAPNRGTLNTSGEDLIMDLPERARLTVVLDDLDLSAGTLRYRGTGSSGGHRGLQSVLDHCGSAARIRYGIGRGTGTDVPEHVMGRFNEKELLNLDQAALPLQELLKLHLVART